MLKEYCAFVHKERGSYGVSFPDFPGCTAVEYNLQDALKSAKEALESHLELMIEENYDISLPSSIEAVENEIDNCEIKPDIVIMLDIDVPSDKTQRVNICAPDYVFKNIDRYISEHTEYKSRSHFFIETAVEKITAANG